MAAGTKRRPPATGAQDHEQLLQAAARRFLGAGRVMRLVVQKARAKTATGEDARFGEGHLFVLHILADAGQLPAGDLAERSRVADPTMSKMLNQLEADGLVARRTDPKNRRIVQVT